MNKRSGIFFLIACILLISVIYSYVVAVKPLSNEELTMLSDIADSRLDNKPLDIPNDEIHVAGKNPVTVYLRDGYVTVRAFENGDRSAIFESNNNSEKNIGNFLNSVIVLGVITLIVSLIMKKFKRKKST